jgi:hypothetical protein
MIDPQVVLDSFHAAQSLHHSNILADACGSIGSCLADAVASIPAKAVESGTKDLTAGLASKEQVIDVLTQQLKPVTSAATNALAPAVKALAPVTDAASKVSASLPKTQDLVKMLPPEVIAAEKSVEVAMAPLIAVMTPIFAAVAQIIHIISNDSDNDLFNGCTCT